MTMLPIQLTLFAIAGVIVAGGAWSTHFAANAEIDLPQLAVRSTVARTGPAPDAYGENFATPGLALRRRADGGYTVSNFGRVLRTWQFRQFVQDTSPRPGR